MLRAVARFSQVDLTHLAILLGRYFQIRDDYMNLTSGEVCFCFLSTHSLDKPFARPSSDCILYKYSKKKGFCEDLEEGKMSLPLIHCLATDPSNSLIPAILNRIGADKAKFGASVSREMKILILDHMTKRTGSLEYTRLFLDHVWAQISQELESLEIRTQRENPLLRLLLDRLQVSSTESEIAPNSHDGII
jgi:geranylgeranyl pyrophosphate synthase